MLSDTFWIILGYLYLVVLAAILTLYYQRLSKIEKVKSKSTASHG